MKARVSPLSSGLHLAGQRGLVLDESPRLMWRRRRRAPWRHTPSPCSSPWRRVQPIRTKAGCSSSHGTDPTAVPGWQWPPLGRPSTAPPRVLESSSWGGGGGGACPRSRRGRRHSSSSRPGQAGSSEGSAAAPGARSWRGWPAPRSSVPRRSTPSCSPRRWCCSPVSRCSRQYGGRALCGAWWALQRPGRGVGGADEAEPHGRLVFAAFLAAVSGLNGAWSRARTVRVARLASRSRKRRRSCGPLSSGRGSARSPTPSTASAWMLREVLAAGDTAAPESRLRPSWAGSLLSGLALLSRSCTSRRRLLARHPVTVALTAMLAFGISGSWSGRASGCTT